MTVNSKQTDSRLIVVIGGKKEKSEEKKSRQFFARVFEPSQYHK
jgi:hypothetical protein